MTLTPQALGWLADALGWFPARAGGAEGLVDPAREKEGAGDEEAARPDEGRLPFCTVPFCSYGDSPYRREWARLNGMRPSCRLSSLASARRFSDIGMAGLHGLSDEQITALENAELEEASDSEDEDEEIEVAIQATQVRRRNALAPTPTPAQAAAAESTSAPAAAKTHAQTSIEVPIGLGRIVASYDRSSTLY
jgi:hypothetical protein